VVRDVKKISRLVGDEFVGKEVSAFFVVSQVNATRGVGIEDRLGQDRAVEDGDKGDGQLHHDGKDL
jgi:hypothetical protein